MNSYQKLKLKHEALKKEFYETLDDPKKLAEAFLRHGIKKDITRRFWFGDGKPSGEIKGLWKQIVK